MTKNPRHPRVGAVVLAAGVSSRMKSWKPGVVYDGSPLVVHSLVPLTDIADLIVIVGGYRFDELKRLVDKSDRIASSARSKLLFVENKRYESGMFSSVQAGVPRLSPSIGAAFVVPGDMPLISGSTYGALRAAFESHPEADIFIPTISTPRNDKGGGGGQKKGHPILLRKEVLSTIASAAPDSILRDVLKELPTHLVAVTDPGICIDIDVESDLIKLDEKSSSND